MNKKLYVGNLAYDIADEKLKELFSQAGTVISAVVITFRETGRSKGFGFVEMATDDEAKKAINTMNGADLQGRKLVVSEAKPPQSKPNSRPSF